jgi:hypothetical protein
MGFEAVVFDLDDTLIVQADTAQASMRQAAALMAVIWISMGQAPPEEGVEVTVVSRIDEVPACLERLRSTP